MLKKSDVKALCSTATFVNGEKIFQEGNLRKVRMDESTRTISGLVLGNFGYYHNVRVMLDAKRDGVVDDYECDCYELTQLRSPCRHCIALALSAVDEEESSDREESEPSPAPETKMAPMERSLDGLREELDRLEESAECMDCETVEEPKIPAEPVEPKGMKILLGHRRDEVDENGDPLPVYWTPNDTTTVFHTNTGIIGTMGMGKTQFTKSLITQLYRQQENNYDGAPLGILIIDYKGDYNTTKTDFVRATNARILKPYELPFNPLALVKPRSFKPLLPVHTANAFKDTLAKVYRLGPKQQTALVSCIMEAYKQCGILAENPSTWDKTAPTFEMVNEIYERNEELAKNDSLASAMQKLSLCRLFQSNPYRTQSLFDLLQGVLVIDLSTYDPDIQNLVVAIILDQFYAQMHAAGSSPTNGKLRRLNKMILVDEAANFMGEDFPALKKILKEGREFGVGIALSTQYLDHFVTGEDNYSRYILTWVVHNVSELKKSDVEYIFRVKANSAEAAELYDTIRSSECFQSAVKLGNAPVCHIRDKAFFEL